MTASWSIDLTSGSAIFVINIRDVLDATIFLNWEKLEAENTEFWNAKRVMEVSDNSDSILIVLMWEILKIMRLNVMLNWTLKNEPKVLGMLN